MRKPLTERTGYTLKIDDARFPYALVTDDRDIKLRLDLNGIVAYQGIGVMSFVRAYNRMVSKGDHIRVLRFVDSRWRMIEAFENDGEYL